MRALVLGASGATGKLVVKELAGRGIDARIVVRAGASLPPEFLENPRIEIVRGNIADFDNQKLAGLLQGCDGAVSCLGHNMTFKGLFGAPRDLVSGTVKRLCAQAEKMTGGPLKLILMSTTAYAAAGEKYKPAERMLLAFMKLVLPPHRDNMDAADHLQNAIGKGNRRLEWVAVRPDTLVDEAEGTAYAVHGSPVRSPVFNAGTTSRINVSRFMAELLETEAAWQQWKYKMPVIYNEGAR